MAPLLHPPDPGFMNEDIFLSTASNILLDELSSSGGTEWVKGGRIAFAPNKSNRPSFDTERQMHALARAAGSARDRLPHGLPNLLSACGFDHKSRHVAKSM